MKTTIIKLLQDESGATAIEYGLIAALVSVAAIGALTTMGSNFGSSIPHETGPPVSQGPKGEGTEPRPGKADMTSSLVSQFS